MRHTHLELCQTFALPSPKSRKSLFSTVKTYCKPFLDRKVDRNADTLQRTITDAGEQDPAPGATGRTATNSHRQSMPNPPFGMPKIPFESRHNSSEARRGLRLISLWGNPSLTGKVTGTRLSFFPFRFRPAGLITLQYMIFHTLKIRELKEEPFDNLYSSHCIQSKMDAYTFK